MSQVQQQEEQIEDIEQPVEQVQRPRRKWDVKGFINSPYLLLMLPLLVGGFFLVLNPQYVVLAMNYPFAAVFILAIPVCLFVVKLVINFFSVIEQWIRLQFEKARKAKKGQFLEFVIAVFMFVSITEGGPLFNKLQGNGLSGALGYITVFAFDLVAVLCMRGRAKMLRKGHDGKARTYQMGVWICALVSVFANLYESIQNAKTLEASNPLTFAAPLAGIAFPVMIIFLSYAIEADADDVDDPMVYREEQEKRVDFVKAKREIAAAILHEKIQMNLLKQREFFLHGWLFTKKKMHAVIEVATQQVMENIKGDVSTLKQSILHEVAGLRQTVTNEIILKVTDKVVATSQSQVNKLLSDNTLLTSQLRQLQADREKDQREFGRQIEHLQGLITSQIEQQNSLVDRQLFDLQAQLEQRFNGVIDSAITRSIEAAQEVCNQAIIDINPSVSRDGNTDDNEGGMESDEGDSADGNHDDKQKHILMDKVMVEVVVKNYPIVESWLTSGVRTITIEQVIRDTGLPPQLVRKREKDGVFQRVKRPGYYRVSSVMKWLFSEPLSSSNKRNKSKRTSDKLDGKLDDNQPITDPTIPVIPSDNQPVNGNHNGHGNEGESPLDYPELTTV